MNNEELRTFKYLSFSEETRNLFIKKTEAVNRIRPGYADENSKFQWPHRIEFFEQIFDLENESLYIVAPIEIGKMSELARSRLYEIKNPVIHCGIFEDPKPENRATRECIKELEDYKASLHYYIISKDSQIENNSLLASMRINPSSLYNSGATAFFSNKDTALEYKEALDYLTKTFADTIELISAIANGK